MTTIRTGEPLQIRAGDTWQWKRTLVDYPAGTWVLKYRFKNAAGGFEIVAGADGTDHLVDVPAATTAAYAAGKYSWVAWVESGAQQFTVDQDIIEVLPDLRAGTATAALDARTHARKVLDAIEAVIEGRASKDQEEYAINGRSLKRTPIEELLMLRSRYRREVADDNAVARGLPTGPLGRVRHVVPQ